MNEEYHLPTKESPLDGAYRSFCENLEEMVKNHKGEWVAIRSKDGTILGYGSRTEVLDNYYKQENIPVLIMAIPESLEESNIKLIDGKVHHKTVGFIDPFSRPQFYSKSK